MMRRLDAYARRPYGRSDSDGRTTNERFIMHLFLFALNLALGILNMAVAILFKSPFNALMGAFNLFVAYGLWRTR